MSFDPSNRSIYHTLLKISCLDRDARAQELMFCLCQPKAAPWLRLMPRAGALSFMLWHKVTANVSTRYTGNRSRSAAQSCYLGGNPIRKVRNVGLRGAVPLSTETLANSLLWRYYQDCVPLQRRGATSAPLYYPTAVESMARARIAAI